MRMCAGTGTGMSQRRVYARTCVTRTVDVPIFSMREFGPAELTVCMDMYRELCADMRMDMCTDMCTDVCQPVRTQTGPAELGRARPRPILIYGMDNIFERCLGEYPPFPSPWFRHAFFQPTPNV